MSFTSVLMIFLITVESSHRLLSLTENSGEPQSYAKGGYVLGALGEVCETESLIRTQEECESAMQALGLVNPTISWSGKYNRIPAFCSYRPDASDCTHQNCASRPHEAHFNTDETNTGRQDLQPVCIDQNHGSGKCLVDNPENADKPLCYIDGTYVDTCSNKGCGGCCGSQCSWVSNYCRVHNPAPNCPSGWEQMGTLSENNNIQGSGWGQTQEASIEDCAALCESTEGCMSIVYGGSSVVDESKTCKLVRYWDDPISSGSNFRWCFNRDLIPKWVRPGF